LFAALNKYYRAMTWDQFLDDFDIPRINNAISIAAFPESVTDWIWEKEKKLEFLGSFPRNH